MIKIFLVDDHDVVRVGIRNILGNTEDFCIIGEASSGEEALNCPEIAGADIVLMDIKMTGIGGIETTKRLLQVYPKLKIIILTALKEAPYPHHLMQVGAKGYLPKDCQADEMIKAIQKVYGGGLYTSPQIAQKMVLEAVGDSLTASPFVNLSSREMEVVLMLIEGQGVGQVGKKLHISPKTVSTYRHRLLQKLHVKNNVELIHLAMQYNLIDKFPPS